MSDPVRVAEWKRENKELLIENGGDWSRDAESTLNIGEALDLITALEEAEQRLQELEEREKELLGELTREGLRAQRAEIRLQELEEAAQATYDYLGTLAAHADSEVFPIYNRLGRALSIPDPPPDA